jgi:ELWxxDGT repeat protein
MAVNIASGSANSYPTDLATINGILYFRAYDALTGFELWQYDGVNPPSLLADIASGTTDSHPSSLTVFDDRLYFRAYEPSNGRELWMYDGVHPPSLELDLWPGEVSSYADSLAVFNGKLFFGGDAGNGADNELWSYVRDPIFADVPQNHWANNQIEDIYEYGITGGCGGGNYCPNNNVTREQMAVFLLKGKHGSAYTPPPASGAVFNDVPAGDPFAPWIEQLAAEGITSGCGNNNYCPDQVVTREQMSVFLLVAKHGTGYSPAPATGVFNDVPAGNGFAKWIEALAAEGITGGCGGGNFCPKGTVTRAQMAVFLVAAFNLP